MQLPQGRLFENIAEKKVETEKPAQVPFLYVGSDISFSAPDTEGKNDLHAKFASLRSSETAERLKDLDKRLTYVNNKLTFLVNDQRSEDFRLVSLRNDQRSEGFRGKLTLAQIEELSQKIVEPARVLRKIALQDEHISLRLPQKRDVRQHAENIYRDSIQYLEQLHRELDLHVQFKGIQNELANYKNLFEESQTKVADYQPLSDAELQERTARRNKAVVPLMETLKGIEQQMIQLRSNNPHAFPFGDTSFANELMQLDHQRTELRQRIGSELVTPEDHLFLLKQKHARLQDRYEAFKHDLNHSIMKERFSVGADHTPTAQKYAEYTASVQELSQIMHTSKALFEQLNATLPADYHPYLPADKVRQPGKIDDHRYREKSVAIDKTLPGSCVIMCTRWRLRDDDGVDIHTKATEEEVARLGHYERWVGLYSFQTSKIYKAYTADGAKECVYTQDWREVVTLSDIQRLTQQGISVQADLSKPVVGGHAILIDWVTNDGKVLFRDPFGTPMLKEIDFDELNLCISGGYVVPKHWKKEPSAAML